MMNERAREFIKAFIPKFFRYHVKNSCRYCVSLNARKVFSRSALTPEWLDEDMLEMLQNKYPYPPMISYQPEDLERSAERRVRNIFRLLGDHAAACHRYLDLGCSEGSVCDTLRFRGKFAAGIDLRYGFSKIQMHTTILLRKWMLPGSGLRMVISIAFSHWHHLSISVTQ